MAIDRPYLFAHLRPRLGGKLRPKQVHGIGHLIDAWERDHSAADLRWLAYILATVEHETACSFVPVEEVGHGRGKAYGPVYYGRGYCQLTWEVNYERFGKLLGLDLVRHPELALDPDAATTILFRGMIEGLFTGHRLADYIAGANCDYANARRIVNGLDRAAHIADLARGYSLALRDGAGSAPCSKAAQSCSSSAAA